MEIGNPAFRFGDELYAAAYQVTEESNRMAMGWIKGENLGEHLPEPPMILAGDVSAYKVK